MESGTPGDSHETCTLDENNTKQVSFDRPCISPEEVRQHSSRDSAWVVVFGKVYDLTDFLGLHPGGEAIILSAAGKDVTTVWSTIHKREWLQQQVQPEWYLGDIVVPEGVSPLAGYTVEKPKVAETNEDSANVICAGEDFKVARKRKMRNQPANLGYTYQVMDALLHLQSASGSKDTGMERIVNLVEERGDPNCTDQDEGGGNTPLLVAATVGSDEHVKRLLQANADPLYKTTRGFSAIHKFAARKLPDARASGVLTALLESRCDINVQTEQGRTPLHVAAQWGQVEMCQLLISKGAQRRLRAGGDGTPADWARACIKDKRKLDLLLRSLDR
jgi:cytochrome b involved in lipid metabolism